MKLSFLLIALSLTALLLPLSIAASNGALILLALAVLLRLRGAERARIISSWRAEPALLALIAYVAAGLISGAFGDGWAKSAADSLKDGHRLWSLGLFVAALSLESAESVAPAVGAGLGLAALVGLAQYARNLAALHPERAHAFVHPVTYGEQMALGALVAGCAYARAESPRARRAAAVVASLCALALLLSGTRAALLSLAAGALVAAVLEPRARRLAVAGFAFGTLGTAAGEWLRYGLARFGWELGSAAATGQNTRYFLWRAAWNMFRDHPWTGVGPGHYLTEFPRYHSGVLEGQTVWASAHDLYLQQLAERGLLGETVLLVLFVVLLTRAWRAARLRRDAGALCAAAAVPAFLVMNITETAWQTEQFATLFLLVWALGVARRAD
jgi:O-antigen ligase